MIVRRELHLLFAVFVLSALWIISSNEIASSVLRYNSGLIFIASSIGWIPVLLIYLYATFAFSRAYQDVSEGIAKSFLTYQFLFVALSTIYFFMQRLNEVVFSDIPADVLHNIQARYGFINDVLKVSWLLVLLVNLGVILYTIYVIKNFSIRYGFASKKRAGKKYPFKLIFFSVILGALYDFSIVVLIKNISIVHAILIEEVPLLILSFYAAYNLIKSLKKFTELTRRVLVSSSIYVILLLAHFILRYVDAQLLISSEDLQRLILSYSPERIILSIILYGTLIFIFVLAVVLSRTAVKLGDRYGGR